MLPRYACPFVTPLTYLGIIHLAVLRFHGDLEQIVADYHAFQPRLLLTQEESRYKAVTYDNPPTQIEIQRQENSSLLIVCSTLPYRTAQVMWHFVEVTNLMPVPFAP